MLKYTAMSKNIRIACSAAALLFALAPLTAFAEGQAEEEPEAVAAAKAEAAFTQMSAFRYLGRTAGESSDPLVRKAATELNIVEQLGRLKYEAALPKSGEFLALDPISAYKRLAVFYTMIGDASVPFLIGRIADRNPNVRVNAVSIIGNCLVPTEAVTPLMDLYRGEKVSDVRMSILEALERVIPDLAAMKKFMGYVSKNDPDKDLADYAAETYKATDEIKKNVALFVKQRKPDAAVFKAEYDRLWASEGASGDYDKLAAASAPGDELALRALRGRILMRGGDPAFEDMQKVNDIIIRDRFAEGLQPR